MGTLVRTFLFTDLEGSTRQWLEDEVRMDAALARHDNILSHSILAEGGSLLKHTGDGVLAVFDDPLDAVRAAVAAQHALRADADADLLHTRMGLHTGPCRERDGDLFGPSLNRAARIMAAAHGGQVVASDAVARAVAGAVPLLDLGRHRLRDLLEPENLHQVVVDDAEAYPPLRSLDSFEHNLPAQRSPLVGREADVAKVLSLLQESRLVTLAGIGGVGKTRLALEAAAQVVGERAVAFVDLAPLTEPDNVTRAVGAAIGLPPGDDGSEGNALLRALRNREVLVVLDNCEHLLDACADLVDDLLDGSPSTTVLATSREPLGLDAERVWRVPSLSDRGAAVELFAQRALAVRDDFRLDGSTEVVVADVCEQLDGIPLAIELAAARVSHLSVEEIAGRLEERFRLLTGGRRRSRQRHQTLQAALDWSHDLLDDAERAVLRRAAVFSGGFTLDALTTVDADRTTDVVLDVLGALVERSLVTVVPSTAGTTRYRLLETVRLYGLDRLAEAGEAAEVRDRHVDWVEALLGAPVPGSGKYEVPVGHVGDERENVVAGLDWAAERGELRRVGLIAARAIDALTGNLWVDGGWRYLGRRDIEDQLEGEELALYLAAGAQNANHVGDFWMQAELGARARQQVAPGSDVWVAATAELANAQAVFEPEQSLDLHEELLTEIRDDHPGRPMLVARSADPAVMTGRLEAGAQRLWEAFRLSGWADLDLGLPDLLLGDHDAVRRAIHALDSHSDLPLLRFRAALLSGQLAAAEGRVDDSHGHLAEAAHLIERHPVRLVDRDVVNAYATLAFHAGDARHAAWLLAVAANGPVWSRSPGMYAVHMHHRRLVRDQVDAEEVRILRAEAADASIDDVLAAEADRRR